MRSLKAFFLAFVLAWMLSAACGGGGGGGGGNGGGGGSTPSPSSSDPCASASLEDQVRQELPVTSAEARAAKSNPLGHDAGQWRVLDELWKHRAALARPRALEPPQPPPHNIDMGEIAVLQDEGDLVLVPNVFDLKGAGLRFSRTSDGGYQLSRIDGAFRSPLGTRLTLSDDDTRQVSLGFSLPVSSGSYSSAFVNSDGNITFEEGDNASTDRNVGRFLTGPPRVAPFFADLDPSTGGRVYSRAESDQFTVTWCGVQGFESANTTTVQVTVLPDGAIEMKFGSGISLNEAIVGVSPGRTAAFNPVDLGAGSGTAAQGQAIGERFGLTRELDFAAIGAKLYRDHPDAYDQLVIWSDQRLVGESNFAFELTVANEVRGIGLNVFDAARGFGSAGRLRSVVNLDAITKYPEDPAERFLGENNTLSLMGQEVGHRWLAYMTFRDPNGVTSKALLGRDGAHWSFFLDSDASVMEGNDIEDLGAGSFRTVDAVKRYSLLDQYVMGLVPESAVAPFFHVENPTNVAPGGATSESSPRIGATFSGTRRDVSIQDVIAVHGPRVPSAADSAKVNRQAFVFIVSRDRQLDPLHVAKIERIRQAWTQFFGEATDGRMRAETRLRVGS